MSFEKLLDSIESKTDDLFVVSLSDEIEVMFRLLPYKQAFQYSELLGLLDPEDPFVSIVYDCIFRSCIEDKYLVRHEDNLPAGVGETVAQLILYLSGVDLEAGLYEYTMNLLEGSRQVVEKEMIHHMKRTIITAFSSYTFESLEQLNYQKIIYIFAQAEQSLMERGIIDKRIEYYPPGENPEEKDESVDIFNQISSDNKDLKRFDTSRVSPGEREAYNLHNLRQKD